MKKAYALALLTAAMTAWSQESQNPFEQTFNGMFEPGDEWYFLPENNGPPPPVPLDGGLTALLLAGGAAGYRQYKKRNR